MKRILLLVMFVFLGCSVFAQKTANNSTARSNETFEQSVTTARTFSPNSIVRCATTYYKKIKQRIFIYAGFSSKQTNSPHSLL